MEDDDYEDDAAPADEAGEDYEDDEPDMEKRLNQMEKMVGKLTRVVEKQNEQLAAVAKEDPPEDEQQDADAVSEDDEGAPGTDDDQDPDEGAVEDQDLPDEPQPDAMTKSATGSTPRPRNGAGKFGLADSGRSLQKAKQSVDIKTLVAKTLEAEHEHSGRAPNEHGPFRKPTRDSKRRTELWIRKNIADEAEPVATSDDISGGRAGIGV